MVTASETNIQFFAAHLVSYNAKQRTHKQIWTHKHSLRVFSPVNIKNKNVSTIPVKLNMRMNDGTNIVTNNEHEVAAKGMRNMRLK